jgi:predicted MFS family arabinose efflux permease
MLALATAMGIGRFAFTPLLPMMLHDGVITLGAASWLASANYIGYLVGALLCMVKPAPNPTVMVRFGLVSTLLLTLGMAAPWPGTWALQRFAAGVASALVFVYTSGWCLSQAALRGHTSLGALIYTGPGAGIVLTGLAASGGWPVFDARHTIQAAPTAHAADQSGAPDHSALEVALLALAYGVAGFGYIVTATFLPVIARQALPGSAWLDLFWPILGSGVIIGALVASRMRKLRDLRLMLLICYVIQATGVALSLLSPSLLGFALGSLLVGLPFTAITYFAMQEARRIRPQHIASTIGLLTALYGLGQIMGPPMAAYLLAHAAPGAVWGAGAGVSGEGRLASYG